MCSDWCPCFDNGASFKAYQEYDEATYNSYGRTNVGSVVLTEEAIEKKIVEEAKKKMAE